MAPRRGFMQSPTHLQYEVTPPKRIGGEGHPGPRPRQSFFKDHSPRSLRV